MHVEGISLNNTVGVYFILILYSTLHSIRYYVLSIILKAPCRMIHELLLALFGFEGDVFLTEKDSGHMKASLCCCGCYCNNAGCAWERDWCRLI